VRPNRNDAEARLKALVAQLHKTDPDLADWLEAEAPDTLSVLDFPEAHRVHLRSTNMLERLNEEIRRRTRVVRIFPNRASCLRLLSALCQEQDEDWTTGKRYLDMALRPARKKETPRTRRLAV
jgi:putative transposase